MSENEMNVVTGEENIMAGEAEPDTVINAGDKSIPIRAYYGRIDKIEGVTRDVLDVVTATPLTDDELLALKSNDWEIVSYGSLTEIQAGYADVVEAHYYFARPLGDAEMVQTLTEEKTQLLAEKVVLEQQKAAIQESHDVAVAEKEEAVQNVTAIKSSVKSVFRDRNDDILIELIALMEKWDRDGGPYYKGEAVQHNGQPYTAIQPETTPHGDESHAPDIAKALWSVYHAKSARLALPYVAPTHAEDIYRKGEFMVWTDNNVYECLENTDRAPDVLPGKWQKVDREGNPIDGEPQEPQNPEEPGEPQEMNSNGTVKWSVWKDWGGVNSNLYGQGDGVTDENGDRFVSNYGNNGSPLTDASWWAKQ